MALRPGVDDDLYVSQRGPTRLVNPYDPSQEGRFTGPSSARNVDVAALAPLETASLETSPLDTGPADSAPAALYEPSAFDAEATGAIPQGSPRPADASAAAPAMRHQVAPGDTLYSIARAYNLEWRAVAAANGIDAPYSLSVGQSLLISGAPSAQPAEVAQNTKAATPAVAASAADGGAFLWPVEGKIVSRFGATSDGRRNDGVNLAAPAGAPVRAAAAGEVLYQGTEIEGFGNLILIKHGDGWVTTYAHVEDVRVREGETVAQGDVIASVGSTGSVSSPQLHFELRRDLKSVDPLTVLASR
ncbi:MAG: peptidoglycan DD-metalloendopeptidase family protein [Pseudomonadota bacterium]